MTDHEYHREGVRAYQLENEARAQELRSRPADGLINGVPRTVIYSEPWDTCTAGYSHPACVETIRSTQKIEMARSQEALARAKAFVARTYREFPGELHMFMDWEGRRVQFYFARGERE